MTKPPPTWYVLVVILLSTAGLAGSGVWYTNFVARRQCEVLVAEVQVYRESPPETDTGRQLAEAKEHLMRDLNC